MSKHKAKLRKEKEVAMRTEKTRIRKKRYAALVKERELKAITLRSKKSPFLSEGDGTYRFGDNILTLKNYKEPLRQIPVEVGVGWYGTLAQDTVTGKVQCHKCGQFRDFLSGHINKTHKMNIRDYREEFGLSYSTALVSEVQRFKLKKNMLDIIKEMSPEEREAFRRRRRESLKKARSLRSSTQPKKTLEQMNKEGSCPDQTLEQIIAAKQEIGHVPSKKEFIRFKGGQRFYRLALKHFGSWEKTLEMCKFSEADMATKPTSKSSGFKRRYSDEELLEYLRIYAQEYRQVPTASDWKRDLLPEYKIYSARFGTIENARQLAGVYQIIQPDDDFRKQSKYYRSDAAKKEQQPSRT